jgi:hypothetical protein
MEAKGLAVARYFKEFKTIMFRVGLWRWRPAASIVFVLISAPVFAATELDGKPEKSDITIALPQPSGAPIPVFLAHEAGLFKKHGINAKIPILNSAVSVQAMISGDADIFAGGATLSNARLRGAPFKFFGATMSSLGVRVEAIQAHLDSLDEKEFLNAKNANPKDFIDNSFVEKLTKSGFVP